MLPESDWKRKPMESELKEDVKCCSQSKPGIIDPHFSPSFCSPLSSPSIWDYKLDERPYRIKYDDLNVHYTAPSRNGYLSFFQLLSFQSGNIKIVSDDARIVTLTIDPFFFRFNCRPPKYCEYCSIDC